MREWLKPLPLGLLLPVGLWMTTVTPAMVGSNISEWVRFAGWSDIPSWLAEKSADHWVAGICIAVSLVYSLVVWRVFVAKTAKKIIQHLHLQAGTRPEVSLLMTVQRAQLRGGNVTIQGGAGHSGGPGGAVNIRAGDGGPGGKGGDLIIKGGDSVNQTPEGPRVSVTNSPGSIIAPSGGTNTVINTAAPRDKNGLYQGDTKVGSIQGAATDNGNGTIDFQALRFNEFPDPGAPLEYQDLLIHCDQIPVRKPNEFVGMLSALVVGTRCKIVGRK